METRIIKNEYSSGKIDYCAEYRTKPTGDDIFECVMFCLLFFWTVFVPFWAYRHYITDYRRILNADTYQNYYSTIEEAQEAIRWKILAFEEEQEEDRLSKIKTIHTVIKYP